MRLTLALCCTLVAVPALTAAQSAVDSLIAAIEGPQSDRDGELVGLTLPAAMQKMGPCVAYIPTPAALALQARLAVLDRTALGLQPATLQHACLEAASENETGKRESALDDQRRHKRHVPTGSRHVQAGATGEYRRDHPERRANDRCRM